MDGCSHLHSGRGSSRVFFVSNHASAVGPALGVNVIRPCPSKASLGRCWACSFGLYIHVFELKWEQQTDSSPLVQPGSKCSPSSWSQDNLSL